MLRLYNTLARSVQEFQPLKPPTVTLYVCGPTVYDEPHIGHARSAYIFDVLRRYLEFKTFQVRFIRNVTDVDDKIIQKAGETSQSAKAVAELYLKRYHDTMDRLGIGRPTEEPRATQHVVPDMTDLISKLLMNGIAYEHGGDVYFAVRKFPDYGKLSNRVLDELQHGARVEPGEHKKDPLDFALWKAAKP
ncbi:MAG: class I tRNA ligase family protein, partial [Candidatus Omnitrophica bacterium]|nr:class I tRNA ligase family protein [Candidatus Omnitrophota bacterium]